MTFIRRSLCSLALFVFLCMAAHAQTFVVPASSSGDPSVTDDMNYAIQADQYPFATQGFYTGDKYQQLYRASSFSGVSTISQIAFASDPNTPTSNNLAANYNITVTLSTAQTGVENPSANYSDNIGSDAVTVFSGALPVTFTNAAGSTPTFDLPIAFTTPFLYDPSKGDLLFDITFNSMSTGTGNEYFYAAFPAASFDVNGDPMDPDPTTFVTSRVYQQTGGSVVAEAGNGLVTQFTAAPAAVPELNSGIVLSLGGALIVLAVLCVRGRHRQGSPGLMPS